LEQKDFAKPTSLTYVDPVCIEHAESQRRLIMKKLDELERAENVQRIRVTVYEQFDELFLFSFDAVCFY